MSGPGVDDVPAAGQMMALIRRAPSSPLFCFHTLEGEEEEEAKPMTMGRPCPLVPVKQIRQTAAAGMFNSSPIIYFTPDV